MSQAEETSRADEPGAPNLSFTIGQGQMAMLLALDRIEERQQMHGKILRKILEKVAPEMSLEAFEIFAETDAIEAALKRIEEDLDFVKAGM